MSTPGLLAWAGNVESRANKVLCQLVKAGLAAGVLWLLALTARAEIPAEWAGQPVAEIQLVGATQGLLDPERTVGLSPGAKLSRRLLREVIRRLLDQGRYADVQVSGRKVASGVALFFRLVPRLLAHRVEVIGNDVLDDRQILRLTGLADGLEIEESAFARWRSAIEEAYRVKGYRHVQAEVQLRDTDDPGRKVVRLQIVEGRPTRIAKIVFEGDPLPKRKGLSRVLRIEEGDIADEEVLRETLERATQVLRRAGFYAAQFGEPKLEVAGHRARILIPSSLGAHYEVQVRGLWPLSRREVLAGLELERERLAGGSSHFAIQTRVEDLYRRHGFADARVTVSEHEIVLPPGAPPGAREAVLRIDIHAGDQLDVVRVSFPGATHFEDSLLREQVFSYLEERLPGSTVFRPVDSDVADRLGYGGGKLRAGREVREPAQHDPRRVFYRPAYDEAIEHLRQLYLADGFLDVDIGEPVIEKLPDSHKAVVVIPIIEGPRTFIYDVRVTGNKALGNYALLKETGLTRGMPFSTLKLEEARVRLVQLYQEQGYYYASAAPEVRMSEDGTRAEITFAIVERYLVHVAEVKIVGNERAATSMIQNRCLFRPGDLYRPSVARDTQDALLALDVFTSVTVAPEDVDLPARDKNVVITLHERKTQYLGSSFGFSTGEGTRGGFEYGYRNLLGGAIHATFRTQLGYQLVFLDSEIQQRYETLDASQRIEYQTTLSVGFPYIPYLPKNTVSVDLTVLSDIQRDFRIQKKDLVGTVVWRPFKLLTLSLSQALETSDFELLAPQLDTPNISFSNLVPDGQNTLVATQLTVTLDLRDRAYNPRRGILLSISPEYDRTIASDAGRAAGLSSDESELSFRSNMLRLLGSFAFYVPLLPKLTFASQVRYGRIIHLEHGSASYPNRLFYLGGTNFRGYYVNQVVPRDLAGAAENLVSHGGQVFVAAQNELRFPLYRELYGGLFTDVGNLWVAPDALDLGQLQIVVGAGLRFQTPVASLALDYGVRQVRTGPLDIKGAFQFAFQTF